MTKKAYFYIDDVIWPFRDLTRERPASMFDHHLLGMLKEAHEKYGLKVILNTFFRTDYFYGDDEFSLTEMTDAYKTEWEENSDWLKIGFHGKQEFPDYPHINIDYDDMKGLFKKFEKEIIRFAGKNTFSTAFNPHWWPVSKDGLKAVSDCGIETVCVTFGEKHEYNGDPASLPYGHSMRLLNNRKPETMVYSRDSRDVAISNSLCGYNHISTEEEQRIRYTCDFIYDKETNLYFKPFWNSACLNLTPLDELEAEMAPAMDKEYVCCATHEQYAYPDYFAYQPESKDKLFKMCEIFNKNNYEFVFIEDLI